MSSKINAKFLFAASKYKYNQKTELEKQAELF